MKASELIQRLTNYPGDPEVVIAKDEEGNGFKYLEDVEYSAIERYQDYEVEVLHPDEEDDDVEYERAVVLWP